MSVSHFAYGSPTGERRGRITDDLSVQSCDGTTIGAVRMSADTGRWFPVPRSEAFASQPRVTRSFPLRAQAARWLATTHAVSQGWTG